MIDRIMPSNDISRFSRNLRALSLLVVAVACDGKNTSPTTAECAQGEERCSCYPNQTCNEGLACLSGLCVAAASGSTGGSANVPASSQASLGGLDAGTASTGIGGSTLLGETSAANFGGTLATGGATGSAAAPTTSGAVGTTSFVASGGSVAVSTSVLLAAGGTIGIGGQANLAGSSGVPFAPNLIKDGAFQLFETYWNAILQEGDSGTYTHPPTAAAVCVTNTSDSSSLYYELSFTIGYPNSALDTFVIEPGATYSLSYTVSATYPLEFQVKIGHSAAPWTEVYSYDADVLSSSYKTFTHLFTSTAGDSSAGLAFNAVLDLYGKMCFQQVSLVKL